MENISKKIASVLMSHWTFIIFAILLVVYNVIGMYLISAHGDIDYWEHLASIYSFSINPLNPPNPYILSNEPTHLFTPYHLFWGVIARISNIHPFWLFPIVAGVNMLLFIKATQAFSRKFFDDKKYALALALTMLFFWFRPFNWSGFYNFGTLPLTSVYPYWFALSVSLFVIAGYGESNNFFHYFLYILAVCCVFLSHPLTGSFLLLSLSVKILTMKSIPKLQRMCLLIIPFFSTILSALLWPYFPVAKTILGSGAFTDIGFLENYKNFYDNAAWRILPALFGLPFLLYSLLKKQFTYISVGLVGAVSIYFLNYTLLHNSLLARYIIYIAFFCQLGIIQTLKHFETLPLYKYVIVGYLIILLFFAFPQFKQSARWIGPFKDMMAGVPIGTHSNVKAFRQYSELNQHIRKSAVIMAPLMTSWELPGVIGCRVVGVKHSNPFMSDFFERKLATEYFFSDKSTVADKLNIMSSYSVDYIIIPKEYENILSDFMTNLSLLYKDKEYSLYALMNNNTKNLPNLLGQ
jgi:hypothetical protein